MASSSSRSKRWILPAVVVLLWLVVGGPLGSFAGKLASVQENDNAAFLPKSAESTIAQEKYTSFVGNESVPTIVVFERDGGLTPEDQKAIAGYADELKRSTTSMPTVWSDRSRPGTARPPSSWSRSPARTGTRSSRRSSISARC